MDWRCGSGCFASVKPRVQTPVQSKRKKKANIIPTECLLYVLGVEHIQEVASDRSFAFKELTNI
jgi:hypothetical protein